MSNNEGANKDSRIVQRCIVNSDCTGLAYEYLSKKSWPGLGKKLNDEHVSLPAQNDVRLSPIEDQGQLQWGTRN